MSPTGDDEEGEEQRYGIGRESHGMDVLPHRDVSVHDEGKEHMEQGKADEDESDLSITVSGVAQMVGGMVPTGHER